MTRLFKNISLLATFDREGRELKDAYILVKDNIIEEIGVGKCKNSSIDEVVDCKDHLILPGFVNTHHHLYQSLFRNVKGVQSAKLFDWLTFLYEKWKYIDYGASYISSIIANYEMILSGVTTTTDMLYLYPYGKNEIFDAEIEGARRVGIRFHPTRGSMSLSKKNGGLPPDSVVQTEEEIIKESIRAIEKYHNPDKYSMLRVALAPCSPFSVTPELMKETVRLADKYDVLIHTHVAETMDEEKFCLEKFGYRPIDYMEKLGWLNKRAWFAHLVWLNDSDIEKLEQNDVGMAHCPASNMRLGSGIAPVFKMKNKNIRIGIAVDGSASNDTNNMLQEIRLAMLLQRVKYGADALTPRETLKMATIGGSQVLRMDDYIGSLEVGKAADFIGFNLNRLEFSGGLSDPVAAVVLCDAKHVDLSVINGIIKVRNGQILDEELPKFIQKQNDISKKLLSL